MCSRGNVQSKTFVPAESGKAVNTIIGPGKHIEHLLERLVSQRAIVDRSTCDLILSTMIAKRAVDSYVGTLLRHVSVYVFIEFRKIDGRTVVLFSAFLK